MAGRQNQTPGSNAADNKPMMSPSKNLSTIECSICCDVFKDPRLLQCGHTFCLECIQQLARTSEHDDLMGRHVVLCPECRKPTRATESHWIKNYRLSDVVVAVQALTAQVEIVKLENNNQSPTPAAKEEERNLVCNDCNEMFTAKHTFFCVVCSHGLPSLKLACGTCGIKHHPHHKLIAYDEVATPDMKDKFISEGVHRLQTVQDALEAKISTDTSATSILYQNIANSLDSWAPLLTNLYHNERLTRYDITEYEILVTRFNEFIEETVKQAERLKEDHAMKVNELSQYFQEQTRIAVASIGTSPQERNQPLVSFPSTSGISQVEEAPAPSTSVIPPSITSLFAYPTSSSPGRMRQTRRMRGHFKAKADRGTSSRSEK